MERTCIGHTVKGNKLIVFQEIIPITNKY